MFLVLGFRAQSLGSRVSCFKSRLVPQRDEVEVLVARGLGLKFRV